MSDDWTKLKTYQTRFELTIVHFATYLSNESAVPYKTVVIDNLFFYIKKQNL